jgi:hypothetical protein
VRIHCAHTLCSYTIHYTLYTIHYTLYTIHYTLHTYTTYSYGLIAGLDEGDSFTHVYFHQGPYSTQYWYSHIAEAYRAFTEIGQVWIEVGNATGRADVIAHGTALLKLAPEMYADLHSSLNRTLDTTASPGHLCYPDNAGMFGTNTHTIPMHYTHTIPLQVCLARIPRWAAAATFVPTPKCFTPAPLRRSRPTPCTPSVRV